MKILISILFTYISVPVIQYHPAYIQYEQPQNDCWYEIVTTPLKTEFIKKCLSAEISPSTDTTNGYWIWVNGP